MICPHCGYPNPNGYHGNCKSCRKPLQVEPVVEKKSKAKSQPKPKAKSQAKSQPKSKSKPKSKKAKVSKKA